MVIRIRVRKITIYVCMKYYSIIVYDNTEYYKMNNDDDDVL
jgi:hypothetical protein